MKCEGQVIFHVHKEDIFQGVHIDILRILIMGTPNGIIQL